MPKDTRIEALLEAHLDQLKKISEGTQSILKVQLEMKKELESLRPIEEEWPVVKMVIQESSKTVKEIQQDVKSTKEQINDLDKKVAAVLPDHEKRITHLEVKPA